MRFLDSSNYIECWTKTHRGSILSSKPFGWCLGAVVIHLDHSVFPWHPSSLISRLEQDLSLHIRRPDSIRHTNHLRSRLAVLELKIVVQKYVRQAHFNRTIGEKAAWASLCAIPPIRVRGPRRHKLKAMLGTRFRALVEEAVGIKGFWRWEQRC